jgi:type IV pilus assembly protein PilE
MHKHGDHGPTRRPRALQRCQRTGGAGFTLIELMLVIAVIGVLAAIAYPSYMDQARKARRTDAIVAMTQIQQAQERWRANNPSYADQTALTASPPAGLGLAAQSPHGYYALALSGASGTGYTLTATAVIGKAQGGDTACSALTVIVSNGVGTATPSECWSQ